MAFASSLNTAGRSGAANRANGLLETLRAKLAQRKLYNQTLHELGQLSDRELADLGLHRGMIRSIAWQAAYDK